MKSSWIKPSLSIFHDFWRSRCNVEKKTLPKEPDGWMGMRDFNGQSISQRVKLNSNLLENWTNIPTLQHITTNIFRTMNFRNVQYPEILDLRFLGEFFVGRNFDLPFISWTWSNIPGKSMILDLFNILDCYRISCDIFCRNLRLNEKGIRPSQLHVVNVSWTLKNLEKVRLSKDEGEYQFEFQLFLLDNIERMVLVVCWKLSLWAEQVWTSTSGPKVSFCCNWSILFWFFIKWKIFHLYFLFLVFLLQK